MLNAFRLKDTQICPNKKCCWQLTGKGTKPYFVEIKVVQQLQALLKRKGFYELLLQHCFLIPKQMTSETYIMRAYINHWQKIMVS